MEQYYQELIGYFSKLLGNKDAATDVVQESYYRAIKTQRDRPLNEPRAYLYRTAKNIVIDESRKNRVRKPQDIETTQLIAPKEEEPEEQIFVENLDEALQSAIHSLPPKCKEAFILNRFHGLTQQEVALKMGVSKNMVEKHIIKALRVCKDVIGQYE